VFDLRVICTCDQCDSPFCALQLTALIKPDWCFILYCCACLYHSLEVVQPSWIAVACPTTKLSLLISKSFVKIKQGVIRVALKTLLKNMVGNLYLQNFTSASARWLCWFYIKLSPHILQKNCAHVLHWLLFFEKKLLCTKILLWFDILVRICEEEKIIKLLIKLITRWSLTYVGRNGFLIFLPGNLTTMENS